MSGIVQCGDCGVCERCRVSARPVREVTLRLTEEQAKRLLFLVMAEIGRWQEIGKERNSPTSYIGKLKELDRVLVRSVNKSTLACACRVLHIGGHAPSCPVALRGEVSGDEKGDHDE